MTLIFGGGREALIKVLFSLLLFQKNQNIKVKMWKCLSNFSFAALSETRFSIFACLADSLFPRGKFTKDWEIFFDFSRIFFFRF